MLVNAVIKTANIICLNTTKVILVPNIQLPNHVCEQAEEMIKNIKDTPTQQLKTVADILQLQPGTLFSLNARVIEVEDAQQVTTRWGTQTKVRNGLIADHTGTLAFAFWRNLAEFPLQTGSTIQITNAILGETHGGLPKVTGSRHTKVELVADDLIQTVKEDIPSSTYGSIEGISHLHTYPCCAKPECYFKKLKDNKCPSCVETYTEPELGVVCSALVQVNDEYQEITLFRQQILEFLRNTEIDLNSSTLEEDIVDILPVKVSFSKKTDNTVSHFRKIDK